MAAPVLSFVEKPGAGSPALAVLAAARLAGVELEIKALDPKVAPKDAGVTLAFPSGCAGMGDGLPCLQPCLRCLPAAPPAPASPPVARWPADPRRRAAGRSWWACRPSFATSPAPAATRAPPCTAPTRCPRRR